MTIGIVLFDDAEELDFAGPWEVFTSAAMLKGGGRVVTIAESDRPVRCAKGMRVLPDHTFANAPALDVLLVPGGIGTRTEQENPAMLEYLRRAAAGAQWVTSVCTGSALLAAAGLAKGRRITSHWSYLDTLRLRDDVTVVEKRRYIRDGNVGRMHILRVEAPTVFRYVLYGGRVTKPDRVDMTGKTTNEYADRAFGKVVTEHLAGCIREGRPTCYRISADVQGRPYRYIRLVMPLGDARVEYLWVGTQRIEVDPSMDRRRLY